MLLGKINTYERHKYKNTTTNLRPTTGASLAEKIILILMASQEIQFVR